MKTTNKFKEAEKQDDESETKGYIMPVIFSILISLFVGFALYFSSPAAELNAIAIFDEDRYTLYESIISHAKHMQTFFAVLAAFLFTSFTTMTLTDIYNAVKQKNN